MSRRQNHSHYMQRCSCGRVIPAGEWYWQNFGKDGHCIVTCSICEGGAKYLEHENKMLPSGTRSWAIFRDGEMLATCERRSYAETILLALDALDSLPGLNAENEVLRDQLECQAVSA